MFLRNLSPELSKTRLMTLAHDPAVWHPHPLQEVTSPFADYREGVLIPYDHANDVANWCKQNWFSVPVPKSALEYGSIVKIEYWASKNWTQLSSRTGALVVYGRQVMVPNSMMIKYNAAKSSSRAYQRKTQRIEVYAENEIDAVMVGLALQDLWQNTGFWC